MVGLWKVFPISCPEIPATHRVQLRLRKHQRHQGQGAPRSRRKSHGKVMAKSWQNVGRIMNNLGNIVE